MLSEELLEQVKGLDDEDKVQLCRLLMADPALGPYAFDLSGLRGNYEAAQVLLDMLEKSKASSQLEVE